ncbi:uncharacterized protein MYCFIDRAFT_154933, partial [Pseudocercospora fijiensis CIRAD86]
RSLKLLIFTTPSTLSSHLAFCIHQVQELLQTYHLSAAALFVFLSALALATTLHRASFRPPSPRLCFATTLEPCERCCCCCCCCCCCFFAYSLTRSFFLDPASALKI